MAILEQQLIISNKVISNDSKLTNARLLLISGIKTILKNGMLILGIGTPEKM